MSEESVSPPDAVAGALEFTDLAGHPVETRPAAPVPDAPAAATGEAPAAAGEAAPAAEGDGRPRRKRRRRGGRRHRKHREGERAAGPQDPAADDRDDVAGEAPDGADEFSDEPSGEGPRDDAQPSAAVADLLDEGGVTVGEAPARGERNDRPRRKRRRRGGRNRQGGDRPDGQPRPAGDAPAPDSTPAGEARPRQDQAQGERPRQPQGDRPRRDDGPREGGRGRRRGRGRREGEPEEAPRTPAPSAEYAYVPEPEPPVVEVTLEDLPEDFRGGAFAATGLLPCLLKSISEAGYKEPTEVQSTAIPLILAGRDIVAASQTGTGKTAAFALPTLQRLRTRKGPRCLILEPTRELAVQVFEQFQKYNKYLGLRLALLYGGVGYGTQREQLRARPDIVIATPGRLLDHISQGALSLSMTEILILDEADRMLDMGFIPDVRRLVKMCPRERQSMLFSATTPPEIKSLAEWLLKDAVEIKIGGGKKPAETVSHAIYPVDPRQKFDLLSAILEKTDYHSVIIFTRMKIGADIVSRWLESHGHTNIGVLHSDRQQSERQQTLADFKEGKVEILVATDIVARGIDISDVSHVINYDIPQHPEDYVHRIGRTGRMHKTGDAFTLMTPDEENFLRAIEKFIGAPIERKELEGFAYTNPVQLTATRPTIKKRNRGYSAPKL